MINNNNRSTFSLMLPLIMGLLFGLLILDYGSSLIEPSEKPEEFALGVETSTYWGSFSGRRIHCSTPNDSDECITAYAKHDADKEIVLWLGNSQLHAINQMEAKDTNAVEILHRSMRDDGKYVMGLSYPNTSLQENYVAFEYLSYKLKVETLILPLVFDDFRETGVGDQFSLAFETPAVVRSLSRTKIGESLVGGHNIKSSENSDMAGLQETIQEQSEVYLNDMLKNKWVIWAERADLRAQIFGNLYLFRNWIFGINASSIRNMIPGRYKQNLEAYNAILESAAKQNINVLTYIVPLRNDAQRPYNEDHYFRFKEEVRLMAKDNGARFADLENLVPSQEWGNKGSTGLGQESEIDFMHFQAKGHQRLAEAISDGLVILGGEQTDDF